MRMPAILVSMMMGFLVILHLNFLLCLSQVDARRYVYSNAISVSGVEIVQQLVTSMKKAVDMEMTADDMIFHDTKSYANIQLLGIEYQYSPLWCRQEKGKLDSVKILSNYENVFYPYGKGCISTLADTKEIHNNCGKRSMVSLTETQTRSCLKYQCG